MRISPKSILPAAAGPDIESEPAGSQPSRFQRLLPRGLRFRLILIVVVVSLLGMVTSSVLTVALQREQLIASARSESARLGSAIQASLMHAMLTDDPQMVEQILLSVARQESLQKLTVLGPDGTVRASSVPGDLGHVCSWFQTPCGSGHSGVLLPDYETTIRKDLKGQDVLLNVTLIRNEQRCYRCHDAQQTVLGALLIERPLRDVNAQMTAALSRLVLPGVATFGFLVGLLVPALNHLITRPVRALSKGAHEIGRGNLSYRVQIQGDDELGRLAGTFNAMSEQLLTSHTEAVALYHLGTRISASLQLGEVLQAIADGARDLLHTDVSLVGLRDADEDDIVVRAVAGEDAAPFRGYHVPLAEGAWGHPLAEGQTVLGETCPWRQAGGGPVANEYNSCLAVPLVRGERVLGLIGVFSRQQRRFTQADADMLTRLTYHVVVAIENARLYQQVHYLAILEERDRLGREMHDNLAQALGYINLKSSIIQHQLARSQVEEAEASLRELKEVVQESYTDVREAIFSLRTAASLRAGMVPMLRDYLLEYRAHYGLDAQLDFEDESLANFSAETQIQVARIVQEALTNIRKHAGATKAWVRFAAEDGFTRVTVRDNGCGFDPDTVSAQGGHFLGLQIMRERAEAVGGRLVIESQPGEGTRIHIFVPRAV